jgi:homopolymeric O-antigen transport system ATP-binding protein
MADYAIQAHGLSKAYRISGSRTHYQYRSFREALVGAAMVPFRGRGPRPETFWALNDVSFEVHHGEAFGIIGRNGAGKSTLLKILSRITRPTRGTADVYGRMGSLLEVGTGFNPELTGRENVFLNGAILGMSRADIRRRFDEIVAFAEVERFLDTPVKRFSSGMYMRLAFAVAAHLEPEILVVDEVLAVGDTAFQARCLGKMEDVASRGRTVLFVSHNMGAITQLCSRVLLLNAGRVETEGPPDEVVGRYLAETVNDGRVDLRDTTRPISDRGAVFEWAEVQDASGSVRQDFSIGDNVRVAFGLRLGPNKPRTKLVLSIKASDGTPVALISEDDSGFSLGNDRESWNVSVDFEDIRFYPGTYHVTLWATDGSNTEEFDRVEDALTFRIVDGGKLTMRPLPRYAGLIFLTPRWHCRADELPAKAGATTIGRGATHGPA